MESIPAPSLNLTSPWFPKQTRIAHIYPALFQTQIYKLKQSIGNHTNEIPKNVKAYLTLKKVNKLTHCIKMVKEKKINSIDAKKLFLTK